MKRRLITTVITLAGLACMPMAHAVDLLQVYLQAEKNDMTYQSAKSTYEAAKEDIPINLGPLLPQIVATGDTSYNVVKPSTVEYYNSNQYQLQLTQTIFDFGQWKTYTQAMVTVKQAAATFALAQQQLVQSVANAYFQVLLDEDQLRFAKQNVLTLKKQLEQTEEQYQVGLKASTDVQSIKANYESGVATEVQDKTDLANDLQALEVITGQPEKNLAPLKDQFPLIKPTPENMDQWVDYGLQHNLSLQVAQLQAEIDKEAIWIAIGGTTTTPGYLPSVDFTGTYNGTRDHSSGSGLVKTQTAEISGTLNVFNGGETYATVKQNRYTYEADMENAEQTRRTTVSNVRQDYLNVMSDISQIEAQKQAVISGEAALAAVKAAYEVGTRTIVDYLTQQSDLFQSQQDYAQAVNSYINDTLSLKLDAGTLSELDIVALNHWLQTPSATTTSTL